ncbi:Glucose-6-phosphate isomerase [Chlamydiales bacterium STE3]|nr:Glucose-6-phosphate isomerase [Chlamydiales bacterium STE3]
MSVEKKVAYNFSSTPAAEALKHLATHPIDLTNPKTMSLERIKSFTAHDVGLTLSFATERVTEEVLDALESLALEANVHDKMAKMQSGEIVNYIEGYPSENRAALHTAVRDFFAHPNTAKPAQEAAALAKGQVEKLKSLLNVLDEKDNIHDLVVIGIGGSELGPKALYQSLEYLSRKNRRVHFAGNIDPDGLNLILDRLELKRTLVCVVSKSGTTLETAVNEELARSYFHKAGIDPHDHFVAVTGEGSPMDNPEKYLECFYIWDWIGGRYSGSSIIGGVILGFAYGLEVYLDFLKGANAMDKAALKKDVRSNLPLLLALLGIWNHNFLEIETLAIIPYSQALSRFPAHLQQLDMESNGKQVDKMGRFVSFATGPIIWGEPGTNAQHSFFQLIHQGKVPIALELIGFKECQTKKDFKSKETTSQEKLLANLLAQAIALAQGQNSDNPNKQFLGNRPSHLILAKELNPYCLGSLLALYEHKVTFQGFIWNINSFDQEGVQLGKVLANRIIDQFAAFGKEKKGDYPIGEAYIQLIKEIK